MRSSELRLASRRALAMLLLVFAAAVSFAPAVRWTGRLLFGGYGDDALSEMTLSAAPMLLASIAAIALAIALVRGREHVLRRTTAGVIVLLAVGMPVGASRAMEGDPLLRLTHDERAALTTLLTIDQFQMRLVGFDVHESKGYLAMRTLHRSPFADAAFQELLHHGTVAGRLYGLCGVYITNPALFLAAKPALITTGTVEQFWGCTVENVSVAHLIESPNGVRLARNQTAREWSECCARADYGRDFDIAGGTLPRMFYEDP